MKLEQGDLVEVRRSGAIRHGGKWCVAILIRESRRMGAVPTIGWFKVLCADGIVIIHRDNMRDC